MSVTFAPEATGTTDLRTFAVVCADGQPVGEFVGYGNAYGQAQAHGLLCQQGLCAGYGAEVREVFAEGEPQPVNVNNRNAADLLTTLGYGAIPEPTGHLLIGACYPELSGVADAEAFLGRVELALGLGADDAALPTVSWAGGGGATYHDCGRAAGYLTGRLTELRTLALACRAKGQRIVWG